MGGPDIELDMSLDRLTALAVLGLVAVVAVFGILALVRIWGLRMQKRGGGCGGLDAEHLRRQRDAGEITQQEYEAILSGMASSKEDKPPRATINYKAEPGRDPERSDPHGQG